MRSFKSLIVPAIIMFLLVAGVAVYFIVSSLKSDPADTGKDVDVLTVSSSDLKSLSIRSGDQDAPLIKIDKALSDDTVDYIYEGDDKVSDALYAQDKMGLAVASLISYFADYVSEDVPLSEYGLDLPKYTVTIEKTDGEKHVILLGNKTPDGDKVYMAIEGESKVYALSAVKAEFASYKGKDFMESTVIDLDISTIDTIRFIRKTDGFDSVCKVTADEETQETVYHFTKPYDVDASAYYSDLIDSLSILNIDSFIDLAPEDLEKYKLKDPAYIIEFKGTNASVKKICLSADISGMHYGYIDGSSDYFSISHDRLRLLDTPVLSFIDRYIAYYNASELSAIKGEYKDNSFNFTLDVDRDEAISDDGTYVELNGRNAKVFNSDGRSYCAVFFESLVCMEISGFDDGAAPALKDPVCTLSFIGRNYQTKVVEFVQRDTDSYYVFVDGEYTGFYVFDSVLNRNGGQDTYSYGVWEAYKLLNTAISENISGVYNIPDDQ